MALSNELVSQFAKLLNDKKKSDSGTITYGKIIVKEDGQKYVRLDGSDVDTPITEEDDPAKASTTTNIQNDDRVSVLIKNHAVTVLGNLSHPSATDKDVADVNDTITELDIAIAKKIQAEEAYFKKLIADEAIIGKLEVANMSVMELIATKAEIDKLIADEIRVTDLIAKKIDTDLVVADNAIIGRLVADKISVLDLIADDATINELIAKKATINSLIADKLDATWANIDFANIDMATIGELFATAGIIKDLKVDTGTVTGELIGVTIKGDLIEAGTLKADRLVVKGSDGNYYALNTDFDAKPGVTPVKEDEIHGSVLVKKSIVAEKIDVKDLVAFGATIGGFHITDDSIYSGAKNSIDSPLPGIYQDATGQFSVGDRNNFLRFYKQEDGSYKLDLSTAAVRNLEPIGRVSGKEMVRIDDVSSVKHEMTVQLSADGPNYNVDEYVYIDVNCETVFEEWDDSLGDVRPVPSDGYFRFVDTDSFINGVKGASTTFIDGTQYEFVIRVDLNTEREGDAIWNGLYYGGQQIAYLPRSEFIKSFGIDAETNVNGQEIYIKLNIIWYVDWKGMTTKKNLIPVNQLTTPFSDKPVIFSGNITGKFVLTCSLNCEYTYPTASLFEVTVDGAAKHITPNAIKQYSNGYPLTGTITKIVVRDYCRCAAGSIENIQLERGTVATEYEPYQVVSANNIQVYGKNLIDFSKMGNGLNIGDARINEDGETVTSAFTDKYYSAITLEYLNDVFLNNKGKTFTYSVKESYSDASLAVVIYGNRTSGATYQGVSAENGATSLVFTVADDFTSVTRLELRFNRAGKPFTTNRTFSEFQLEVGATATDYETYKEPVIYYANEDGFVSGVLSIFPTVALITNNPYVTIDCAYNRNNTLGDDRGNQFQLENRVIQNESSIANLTVGIDGINAEVQKNTKLIEDSNSDTNARLIEVEKKASVAMDAESVNIAIIKVLSETGASRLKTSTGYVFDDEGMTVHKSDSEMKTQVSDNGMTVYKKTGYKNMHKR